MEGTKGWIPAQSDRFQPRFVMTRIERIDRTAARRTAAPRRIPGLEGPREYVSGRQLGRISVAHLPDFRA